MPFEPAPVGLGEGNSICCDPALAGRDRLPALAADLVSRKVAVIAAAGGGSAQRAASTLS